MIDWLRLRLFQFSIGGSLGLVVLAVTLSLLRSNPTVASAVAAGTLMAAPLILAARYSVAVWRAISLRPQWMLLIGPLNIAAGLLGDRSAFLYPSLAWIAVAVLAGGVRWGALVAVVLSASTTSAAVLAGVSLRAVVQEAPTGLMSRLFLAVAMASLAEGLAQIVWARTLASTPQVPPSLPRSRAPRAREQPETITDARVVVVDENVSVSVGSDADVRAPTFTVREKEVIALLAEGLNLAEAADALDITYRAARARVDRARERIGARTAPELVKAAVVNGDVPLT